MLEEKNYVGLQLCFICRKEPISVLLDRRLKPTLTDHEIGLDVCEKCKEKYLKNGVLLIEANKEEKGFSITGSFTVIKESVFRRIFKNVEITEKRTCFVEPIAYQKLFGSLKVKGIE